jgi:hypothetical protein
VLTGPLLPAPLAGAAAETLQTQQRGQVGQFLATVTDASPGRAVYNDADTNGRRYW